MKNTAVLRLHSGTRVLNGARFKITPIVKEGDGMMKKISTMLLCIILAGALACTSFAVIDIPTYKDSDRDEQDYDTGVFWVDDIDTYFRPGADYYLEVTWDGDEMTDEFFEQYTITQSIVSDTEGVSNSSVKSRLTAAEFVKGANGNYYYHIGISGTSRYSDDIDAGIVVFAKDKEYPDDRAACLIEFTIGYDSDEDICYDEEYDLPDGGAVVEFDEELDRCLITFFDDSTLNLKFGSVYKFNLCYDETVNAAVQAANPNAELEQKTFYGRPKFADPCTLKLYGGDDMKYLYELNSDNRLTLLSSANNNGYFGIKTQTLGAYILSDTPLKGASVTTPDAASQDSSSQESSVITQPDNVPANPNTGAAA